MFTQVDRSAGSSGLGIGLTLVKSLVEMHGGTVRVESDGEHKGSRFTVCLPVATTLSVAELATPVVSEDSNPDRYRVLVVDDNDDARQTLSRLIRILGHKVHTAADGVEAIEAAQQFQPKFVVIDLGMPRMDGLEAARRIRQEPWGARITLVAATGWGQEHDKERSRAAGFDLHLVKPIDFRELQRVLRRDSQLTAETAGAASQAAWPTQPPTFRSTPSPAAS
jgi:CheY-like chemotaxis protein